MFPPTDNPAARLVEILTVAESVRPGSTIDAWAKVLGIDRKEFSVATFYKTMGYLNSLVDATEVRIKQEDGINHDLFLQSLPTIRHILSPDNVNIDWNQYSQPLRQGALTALRFCAEQLSRSHKEELIPENELQEIRAMLGDALAAVTGSDMPINLKLVLFDLLTSAIASIENYRITGNDGIKRSIAQAIGLLALHKDILQDVKEKQPGIMKKCSEALDKMAKAVTTAYQLVQIGDRVTKLLH